MAKRKVGMIISDKPQKTVVVKITNYVKHPLYKKYITWHKNLMARDESNEAAVGDTVRIRETRPLSKRINWKVIEIVEKAQKG